MNKDTLPDLKPGRYRHYKNQDYAVLRLARHSETEEVMVVYQQLYGSYGWWVRPYKMFVESIVVDGRTRPRFTYIGPPDAECYRVSGD